MNTCGRREFAKGVMAGMGLAGLKPGLYASVSANGYLNVDNPGRVNRTVCHLNSVRKKI